MRTLTRVGIAVALSAVALVALAASARPQDAGPEPMAVHAMRLQHPDLVRGVPTSVVGDRVAQTLVDIRAGMPTSQLVNRARVRWGAGGQGEALQVVLTLWGGFAADAPTPNGDGSVEPTP